jgi:hypothetical protein
MSQPTRLNFPEMAEEAIQRQATFLQLAFHPAAVAAVDEFFTLTWGEAGLGAGQPRWTPTRGHQIAIVDFGVFFGELLRRLYGGQWREDPEQPDQILLVSVLLPKDLQVRPFHVAMMRLQHGAQSGFGSIYDRVRAHMGTASSPEEADGWLVQARFFERIGREDIAAHFRERAFALRPPVERPASDSVKALARAISSGKALLETHAIQTNRGAMTLAALDLLVDRMFGAKPVTVTESMTNEQLALGAFIGDVYCRRFRGRWRIPPGAGLASCHVTWPSGIAVNPFELLRRRLESGSGNLVLAQVAQSLKPLLANGEAEDPPEIAAEWAAQAEDFAKDPARLPWALHFGKVAILDGMEGAAFRVRVAGWARALDKLGEAAAQLKSAAELEPGNAAIALEQADVASGQKDLLAAELHAQRAATLRPDAPAPWFALAAAQAGLQKYRPAIESYKKAIALAPERAAALADMLMMLEALRDDADDPLP